jgi:hypothetical protein
VNLKILKLSDGSNVLAVAEYVDATYSYNLSNPISFKVETTATGEQTTALPFIPGTDHEVIHIPSYVVIATAPPTDFFRKFYGSSLLRFFVNKTVQAELMDDGKLSNYGKCIIQAKRDDLMKEYGLIDTAPVEKHEKRVLH